MIIIATDEARLYTRIGASYFIIPYNLEPKNKYKQTKDNLKQFLRTSDMVLLIWFLLVFL